MEVGAMTDGVSFAGPEITVLLVGKKLEFEAAARLCASDTHLARVFATSDLIALPAESI